MCQGSTTLTARADRDGEELEGGSTRQEVVQVVRLDKETDDGCRPYCPAYWRGSRLGTLGLKR